MSEIDVSLETTSQTIDVSVGGGSGYVLPPATKNRLGGVIVGDNINVTSNGTISIPDASDSTKGVIEIATDEEASTGESETLAINPKQLSTKQDVLVSGTNIKTINNASLLGSGNIEISGSSGFLPFPESWPTSSSYTTKQFCDAVNSDSGAVVGMAYLGEVYFSDLSTVGLVNSEITVEIMAETTSSGKVILLRMTSGNHAPYQWQYTYWNSGSNVSGWIGFQPELPLQSGNNGKFLTTNGSDLSWGSAPVISVNSKTGAVSLSASDVNALPDNTHIPADPVQSNWDEENTESLAYIQNKPTIPAAQVNSDWNANSGVAEILNKPSLAAVATSGAYSDLTGTPTIPAVGNGTITIAQGGISKGTFTVNQSGNTTINLDSGGGSLPDQTGHAGEFLTTNGTAASWASVPVTSINSKTGAVTLTATDVGALPDSTVIPAAQVNSDWNSTSGVSEILNKPTLGTAASASTTDFATAVQGLLADTAVQPGDLATVATSGNYNDLSNKPTIPIVYNATLTIRKNGTTVQTFTANSSINKTADITVPTDTSDLSNGAGFITGISSGDVTTALGYTPVNPSSLATVATSGSYADLSNKPSLAAVATSGAYSDLTGTPTIPTVNDATITITQGGVTKGSFTLNQSSGDTIALDAGGGGSLPDQTGNSGKFLTTNGSVASWGGAVPTTSSSFKIYATDSDGNQTTKDYTTANTGSTIVQRSSAGQVSVALTPTSDPHATSKKYVDDALANKVSTGHEVVAYQAPSSQNNYTWYRKYADGWVEQGGFSTNATNPSITLPIAMSDTNYWIGVSGLDEYAGERAIRLYTTVLSETQFQIINTSSAGGGLSSQYWEVKGLAGN